MQIWHRVILTLCSAALIAPAQAADGVEINSFMTLGLATSTNDDGTYLERINSHLSLENDSHYGINIRTDVNDKIKGAAQLLASSDRSNFNIEAEWAYLSYKVNRNSSIRAGKLNLTTFLLSDYITVGSLYPWVRPPEEVYANNPMKNFLGAEWLHISRFGNSKLTSQVFFGSAQVQPNALTLFRAMDGYGVNFQLDTRDFTLRLGAISPQVQVEITNGATTATLDDKDRALMYTLGASWDINSFIGYMEYVNVEVDGQTRAVFPNQEGGYITLGYQMGRYLPHVTVASSDGEFYPTGDPLPLGLPGALPPNQQKSIALGLRYDVDDNIDLKFEIKQVEPEPGTTGLNSTLPSDGESFEIISMAVDVIF